MGKLSNCRDDICSAYLSGLSTFKIAELYESKPQSINYILRTEGVPLRSRVHKKYSANYCFFDEIDTEQKAYVLGLAYADGSNYRTKKTFQFSIKLHSKDRQLLENIRSILEYTGPLLEIGKRNQTSILISDKHLSNTLVHQGVVSCKSLVLKFPNSEIIREDLVRHFIRGYFDGDGGFIKDRNWNSYRIGIVSTHEFCASLQKYLIDNLNISSSINLVSPKTNSITSRLRFGTREKIVKFCDHIYKDATIWLHRKKDQYEAIVHG